MAFSFALYEATVLGISVSAGLRCFIYDGKYQNCLEKIRIR